MQKYIVLSDEIRGEMIFVFPVRIDHDRMYETFDEIRFESDAEVSLVSAGFVTNGVCHGRSETLDICSRVLLDTLLITHPENSIMLKYIVVADESREEMIFVFPTCIDHDHMYQSIQSIRFGSERNWIRELRKADLISAGFVTDSICHGRSETLDIDSRGELDTVLLLL